MIEITHLRKRFGPVQAVRDINFRVDDGEVVGLLGRNGAGKTTTLRMLSGLMPPDTGEISVDGFHVAVDSFETRRRMGVLPDSRGLYPRLTALEHIEYFGRLQGMSGNDLQEEARRLISDLDLRRIAHHRVAGFSHGERTKVALARALVHRPQNVILDEPTDGLDVVSTRTVRELIRRLRAQGRCVLFSSHIMQEVSALCDRIVVIARGLVVGEGAPDALREQTGCRNLEDAFVSLVGLQPEGELEGKEV